jgi:serine/threonine protein kinase
MKTGIGTHLGRYEIDAEIGRGAMGLVYQAHDPKIDRPVAIKTISLFTQEIEEEQEFRERFFLEARAAGRLSHPGIVTIFDVGEDSETHEPYIVMEFVAGQPLSRILTGENRKLALGPALQITQEIAEALNYAHSHGVVHRDIKPANILITRDGHPKIADFGIAKLNQGLMTIPGQVLGSPAYMAPEQLSGESADLRSDLFSLGVILYSMLTGFRPFQGNSAATVSFKVVNRDPLPVTSFDCDFPAELDRLVSRAIAKDPAQRYQTGMEMAQDIQRLRERNDLLEQTAASLASVVNSEERKGAVRFSEPMTPATPRYQYSAVLQPKTPPSDLDASETPKAMVIVSKRLSPVVKHRLTRAPKEIALTAGAVFLLAMTFIVFKSIRSRKPAVVAMSASITQPSRPTVKPPSLPTNTQPPSVAAVKKPALDHARLAGSQSARHRTPAYVKEAKVKVIRKPKITVAAKPVPTDDAPKLTAPITAAKFGPPAKIPASLQNIKASAPSPIPAMATLQLQIEYRFAEAEASVWIDDQLIYSRKLFGESKKRALLFKKVEGRERSSVKISAGEHRIRVRVQSASAKYDQSQTIAGNFSVSSQNVLDITCGKHQDELQLTLQ